jgi:FecR protein
VGTIGVDPVLKSSTQRMFNFRKAFTVLALGGMVLWGGGAPAGPDAAGRFRVAQAPAVAQPAPPSANPIGAVATLQGGASVTRSLATNALKVKDAIFKGDVLQTTVNGTLGITFDDATTFSLRPNTRIAVDDFVYQERGTNNIAAFDVVRGTMAFVASAVAKTGDMKIVTPTATIGIRGTTGVIEVPTAGAGAASQSIIKLYPDADGRVGRIELFGRDGRPLGVLSRAVTGFAVRAAPGGGFAAVAVPISASESDRDFAFVRQAYAAQRVGRQLNLQRQNLQRQNLLRQNRPTPTPTPPAPRGQRLNLLPPGRSIGPTLLQPQPTLPATIPPDVPTPQQGPDTVPPLAPPNLSPPSQPLPGGVPSPTAPSLPRLPLPR